MTVVGMSVSVEPVAGPAGSPDLLARWEQRAVSISQRIAFAGVVLMLGIGVLMAVDVLVLRAMFNAPIAGSNEPLTTIFAVGIGAVLAGGLADRTTLEIDLFEKHLSLRTVATLRAIGAGL